MCDKIKQLVEGGSVEKMGDSYLVVEVDGVELFVDSRVNSFGCSCCGDSTELSVSYNRRADLRAEEHGSEDPLGIEDLK